MSAKHIAESIAPLLEPARLDGSYLLAVCKLDALLRGKSPIGIATVRRAVALPKEIARKCEKFIADENFERIDLQMPEVDIKEMAALLFEEITPEWLAEKLGDVSDIEKDSFALSLGNALAFLQERIPKIPASKKTKLSELKSASFVRLFRVVSEPLSVLDDMLMGCLCRTQVETLLAVYPVLHEAMSFGMTMAATDALAKDSEYTLPWAKLKQLSVLNLSSSVSLPHVPSSACLRP